MCEEKVIYWEI